MKIGIITIMDYTNYGNRLQNYAVSYIFSKKAGCKVKSIVSSKDKRFENGNLIGWLKNKLLLRISIEHKFIRKRLSPELIRTINFRKWSKRIPTRVYYNSLCLPRKLNDKYDIFLAGSDQIWNYNFTSEKLSDYFLEFAESGKKVSLSASFGIESIPKEWQEKYKKGLQSFSFLSVREEAGQDIIQELVKRKAKVLIDPVMMLTAKEWLKVSNKPHVDISKPYVLKYYLGEEDKEQKIDDWAKKNNYAVYELLNKNVPELYEAGPGEFLTLINNASLICSDSFHCIVFSIIFSRPFIVYSRLGKEENMNSRLTTLLKKFEFQDRWINQLSENEYLSCDFNHVEHILNEERKKFKDYINEFLNSSGDGHAKFSK